MTPNTERLKRISDAQWNVIILLARGYTYEEIAERMKRNPRTVKDWSDRLRYMLDVERSAEIPYRYFKTTGNNPFTMKLRALDE